MESKVRDGETLRAAQGDGQTGLAGRELDAAVAERVMGWHLETVDGGPVVGQFQNWLDSNNVGKVEPYQWSPSTDIAAAMEVVEKVGDVTMCSASGFWFVEFSRRDAPCGNARGSLPEAICRAALAAVVHNQNEEGNK